MVKLPDLRSPAANIAASSSLISVQGGPANFMIETSSVEEGDGEVVIVKDSPSSPIFNMHHSTAKMLQNSAKKSSGPQLSPVKRATANGVPPPL